MKISTVLIAIVFIGIASGILILISVFYPVIMVELDYQLKEAQGGLEVKRAIVPKNSEFGIVIPKIAANAKVIPNVDPYNKRKYQVALTEGVAHALNTSFPGEPGNVFLFAHSSVNFYDANRYNTVFYLLEKLEKGDEIDLYYGGEKFKYSVTDKETVNPEDVVYLDSLGFGKTVTLMTSWPPGTTYKRLLIAGELVVEDTSE